MTSDEKSKLKNMQVYNRFNSSRTSGTKIIQCNSGSSSQSPVGFPNPLISPSCFVKANSSLPRGVATSSAISAVASFMTYPTRFGTMYCTRTVNTLSPYQDCFNLVGMFCLTASPLYENLGNCHQKVIDVANFLNKNWQNYLFKCANWMGGNYGSNNCTSAISTILTVETYTTVLSNGAIYRDNVPPALIESVRPMLLEYRN